MSVEAWKKDAKIVPWFLERPSDEQVSPAARRLLETYSNIPADQVTDHIVKTRNEAWKIFPYPCIGQFRFLDLSLKQYEEYEEVLERLRKSQTLLDIGCCFGQELRQLSVDGAPSENLYGCDLEAEYIELGYKLFQDRDRLHAKFLTANIFDNASSLSKLHGTFDMVYAGSFFHLFGYENQVVASKVVAMLLRPQKNSMLLGRQVGSLKCHEAASPGDPTKTIFHHDAESFKSLWVDIGKELGISFAVQVTSTELSTSQKAFLPSEYRWLHFVVRRE